MAKYGSFFYGEEAFGGSGQILSRVPWIFQELHSSDEYEFAINPLDAQMPGKEKTFSTQPSADGTQIIFQGRDKVQRMSFSGTILTEAHLIAMKSWSNRDKQIHVMDDLGRGFWIYLKGFSPTREYHPDFPWRHQFSCDAVVLDWGDV